MTPDEYCQQKTARSGSSFYYSFLFLPPDRRRAITALYAFCREVDDVVDEVSDPTLARTKLAWWRSEVSATFMGAPQHPVALALKPVVAQYRLPEEHFQTVIDGMAMDLDRSRYFDFTELERYCHCVAGVVGLMSAEIFGYVNPATRQYARDLGIAFQLTNIIRDVKEDAEMGRVYLPLEDLQRFELTPADLQGKPDKNRLRSLLAVEADRARDFYKSGFELIPLINEDSQPALWVLVTIYKKLLEKIAQRQYDVYSGRIRLTRFEKLSILGKGFVKRMT